MPSVTVDLADHIATVTLDRPPVNAVDRFTMAEIRDVLNALDDDHEVRVAVFTAVGDRAFMAGADLAKLGGDTGSGETVPATLVTDPPRVTRDAMWSVLDCAVPVIGAINGPALGAGLAFAACCDILVAAEGATFGTPEINVGLLGASSHLTTLVGRHKARELYFTGEPITAEELYRLGALQRGRPPARAHDDRPPTGQRAGGQEPHRIAPGQGGHEPHRAPAPEGGLPHRTGVHRPPRWLRGRRRSPGGAQREASARLEVALIHQSGAAQRCSSGLQFGLQLSDPLVDATPARWWPSHGRRSGR